MEDQHNIHHLLSEKLSAENSGIDAPPLKALEHARKTVLKKKQRPLPGREDIFSLLAGFLNMKIKLYHAVIATVLIAAAILLYNEESNNTRNEADSGSYDSNIAAVNNNTVLSSINTCVTRK